MNQRNHTPEEIFAKLRRIDVITSRGASLADAIESIGLCEVTYYRWRRKFGGLDLEQVRRLVEQESNDSGRRMPMSGRTFDNLILLDTFKGF